MSNAASEYQDRNWEYYALIKYCKSLSIYEENMHFSCFAVMIEFSWITICIELILLLKLREYAFMPGCDDVSLPACLYPKTDFIMKLWNAILYCTRFPEIKTLCTILCQMSSGLLLCFDYVRCFIKDQLCEYIPHRCALL